MVDLSGNCALGLYNNAAVAVASALARGLERVLVVDWDVHHGNGTQHIYGEDDRVLFISLHRHDNGQSRPSSAYSVTAFDCLQAGSIPLDAVAQLPVLVGARAPGIL